MSDNVDEWVCLDCYNRWQPQTEPDGAAQCSHYPCRSRFTFPLPVVENHVRDVQEFISELPAPIGDLGNLPSPLETLPGLLETGRDMVQKTDRPRVERGLDLMEAVLEIVRMWGGEDREPIEDAIDRLHAQHVRHEESS